MKICVLSLMLERVVERTCKQSWFRIRQALLKLQASKYQTKNFYFFQRNEPSPEISKILKALDVSLPKKVLEVSPRS